MDELVNVSWAVVLVKSIGAANAWIEEGKEDGESMLERSQLRYRHILLHDRVAIQISQGPSYHAQA